MAGYARLMNVPGSTAVTAGAPGVYRSTSLFNEHTWGAGDPWTHGDHGHGSGEKQWHWKYAQAMRAHDDAETLLDAASALLGEAFTPAADAAASFYAVNTCSWPRTETARLFLPGEHRRARRAGPGRRRAHRHAPALRPGGPEQRTPPRRRPVPARARHRRAGLRSRTSGHRPRGAPAAQDGEGTDAPTEAAGATVLENDHLRVTVDLREACIASVIDKRTGREMVRQDAVIGFNGYVYDEYATAGGFNHQSSKTVADDSMHLPRLPHDRTARGTRRPHHGRHRPHPGLRMRPGRYPPAPGEVHLPHHAARIDVENRVDKTGTLTKESAFFAFPFALDNPTVHTEATGGVLGTDRETVPGSATHMRAVRRWISLSDGTHHAALATADALLVQLGENRDPVRPLPPVAARRRSRPPSSPWVHNNIWDTNFPAQQAFDHVFRYSVGFAAAEENTPAHADELAARVAAVTSHLDRAGPGPCRSRGGNPGRDTLPGPGRSPGYDSSGSPSPTTTNSWCVCSRWPTPRSPAA